MTRGRGSRQTGGYGGHRGSCAFLVAAVTLLAACTGGSPGCGEDPDPPTTPGPEPRVSRTVQPAGPTATAPPPLTRTPVTGTAVVVPTATPTRTPIAGTPVVVPTR
jgi:hypothetical protein